MKFRPFLIFFVYLIIAQIVIGTIAAYSGYSFLQLKAWSRTVLEIICWLTLIYAAGFMVYWINGWVSFDDPEAPSSFMISGLVMCMFVMLLYCVPLGLMIWKLRSKQIRKFIKGSLSGK